MKLVLACVAALAGGLSTQSANSYDLQYLDDRPEVLATLQQWQSAAPPAIQRDIAALQDCTTAAAVEAAARLKRRGPASKGATLALIGCLGPTGPQGYWVDRRTGQPVSGYGVHISGEAAAALRSIGTAAMEPLVLATALSHSFAADRAGEIVHDLMIENRAVRTRVASVFAEMLRSSKPQTRLAAALKIRWDRPNFGPAPDTLIQAFAAALSDEDDRVAEVSLGWLMELHAQTVASQAIAAAPLHGRICRPKGYVSRWRFNYNLPASLRTAITVNIGSTESRVREQTACLIRLIGDRRFLDALGSLSQENVAHVPEEWLDALRASLSAMPPWHN